MVDENRNDFPDEDFAESQTAGFEDETADDAGHRESRPSDEGDLDPYEAMEAADPEGATALRNEWGAEFDANLELARSAARTVADQDLVDMLEENGLGNDPRIVRAAANIGRLLEAQISRPERGQDEQTEETLQTTLDELSKRPDYWSDQVQRRVRRIHLALHGDGEIPVHRASGDVGNIVARHARSLR